MKSLFSKIASGFIVLCLLLTSCDIIEAPFMETGDNGPDTTTNPQKVLLFDFTGHTCKSCPKAHKSIDQMKDLYGNRLVPIAFHLGYFARPLSSGKFTTDFRTPEGTLLEKFFDFVAFPIGSVQSLDKDQLKPYASWSSLVFEHIAGYSPIKIQIVPTHFHGLSEITLDVIISARESVSGPLSLAVYLIEDGIVDWQKDEDFDPMDIPDYVHNHVFRTSLNGLWGQQIAGPAGLTKGNSREIELSKALNTGWNVENCMLVAFVFHEDTKEVVQVEAVGF